MKNCAPNASPTDNPSSDAVILVARIANHPIGTRWSGGHGEARGSSHPPGLGVSPSWHASTLKGLDQSSGRRVLRLDHGPTCWRGRPDLNRQLSGGRPYPVDLAIGDEY